MVTTMVTTIREWFYLAAVIAVMGICFLVSPAFAEGDGGASKEGIKVHGHWKIEIFNPDGKRVSVTEFNNSYVGSSRIEQSLNGYTVFSGWGIQLDATSGTKPCDDAGTPSACNIGESGVNYAGINLNSTNLTRNLDPSLIILNGSVTASSTSTIDQVKTTYSFCCCGGDVTSSACRTSANNVWFDFTSAVLTTPPSVVPGQLIQVTVTITFS